MLRFYNYGLEWLCVWSAFTIALWSHQPWQPWDIMGHLYIELSTTMECHGSSNRAVSSTNALRPAPQALGRLADGIYRLKGYSELNHAALSVSSVKKHGLF